MKITFLCFGILFTFLLNAAPLCQAPAEDPKLQPFEDVVYKQNLAMDIYLPASGKDFPVAFIIHGGAWIAGSRKDFTPVARQLTGMGYAAVTVSYRLANNANGKFPAPIEDLRCALKTLRRNRSKYSLNTDKILAMGNSAGAHLAAELALTADSQSFDDTQCPVQNYTTEVHNVIAYYGPFDLRKTEDLNAQQLWILSNFLGGLPIFKPRLAALASPAVQIHDEDVPFYLVHAVNDDVVPVKSSQEFSVALREKNKDFRYIELQDGKHSITYFDERDFAQEATCGILDVLEKFLK